MTICNNDVELEVFFTPLFLQIPAHAIKFVLTVKSFPELNYFLSPWMGTGLLFFWKGFGPRAGYLSKELTMLGFHFAL